MYMKGKKKQTSNNKHNKPTQQKRTLFLFFAGARPTDFQWMCN